VRRFGEERVFIDLDAIRPGSDFAEVIAEALDHCDVLLALIGPTWLTRIDRTGRRRLDDPDDLVRVELETALRRGITLIPLLVGGANMPAPAELPGELAGVAAKQALELSDRRWRTDILALIDELEGTPSGRSRQPDSRQPGIVVSERLDRLLGLSGLGSSKIRPEDGPARPRARLGRRWVRVVVFALALMLTAVGIQLLAGGAGHLSGSVSRKSGPATEPPGVDGGPADQVRLSFPYGVALDDRDRIYIADSGNLRVRRVDGASISTIAGTGEGGNAGDGRAATEAKTTCHGVAVAADGSVLIAAIENNNVRRVDPAGTIRTLAGNGIRGYSGDGGPAVQAQLSGPWDVDVGPDGAIYIADTGNNRIRRVDTGGRISTVAGTGTAGFAGDGGPATEAQLTAPRDVAVGPDGALFLADGENNRVRRVDAGGQISTVAGTGTAGFAGDGGQATQAQLNTPHGVDVDAAGNVYIADLYNNRVRMVDRSGIITTIAGTGVHGYSGDGGPAVQAELAFPRSVAVGTDGTVYIADINNNRIRKIDSGGTITTAAGRG